MLTKSRTLLAQSRSVVNVARHFSTGGVSSLDVGTAGDFSGIERMEMPDGIKLGDGGRHSRAGKKVAIFGSSGFLGGFVVNDLGKNGHNMVVATRGDDDSVKHLRTCADYGKLVPSYISLKDEKSIRETIRGADVVINLMGKHYETKHYLPMLINCTFEEVNVKGAEMVARISREENVKHLVHVSAANASKDSKSRIATTKAEGEERVRKEFPGAAIVRPNKVYGDADRYLIGVAEFASMLPYFPLLEGGKALQSPVSAGDVGTAISAIAQDYSTAGESFNLSGNHEYTTKEFIEYVMNQTGHYKPFFEMPTEAAVKLGGLINNLPNPYFNEELVKLLLEDVPKPRDGEKTFADLGMDKLDDFERQGFQHLYRFIKGGHFDTMTASKPPAHL